MSGSLASKTVCASLLALAVAGAARAERDPAFEVADILSGIAHYTRWPGPAGALRICLQQPDPALADALRQRLAATDSVVVLRWEADSPPLAVDCRIVYVAETSPAVWRPLVAALIGQPVLTVGRGEDFCSYGGLFCLVPAAAGLRIQANLDSISRSGLHVNAQLLRLARRGSGAR